MALSSPLVDRMAASLLVGSVVPRRALFLDRDGVINIDHGYVHSQAQTDWVPGIFDLVARAHRAGYLPIVITNQAGIARGYYTEEAFRDFTSWMHEQFRARGAPLLATYFCPHHPDEGVGEYSRVCSCRKPAPGLILQASSDFCIDTASSVMIGDKQSDLQAALAAGASRAFQISGGRMDGVRAWLNKEIEGGGDGHPEYC